LKPAIEGPRWKGAGKSSSKQTKGLQEEVARGSEREVEPRHGVWVKRNRDFEQGNTRRALERGRW